MTLPLYVPGRQPGAPGAGRVKLWRWPAWASLLFAVPTGGAGAAALPAVLLVGLRRRPAAGAGAGRQARAVLWWLVLLFGFHLLVTDLRTGALAVLRLLTLLLAAAVVTATTRVTALVAVVERLGSPLRVFGVRPARIGLVIAMTLRFIPLVADRAARIREAQAARGGRPGCGPADTVVPLLVQVLQLAHTVGEALDARGADDAPARRVRRARRQPVTAVTGTVAEIWLTGSAAAADAPGPGRPAGAGRRAGGRPLRAGRRHLGAVPGPGEAAHADRRRRRRGGGRRGGCRPLARATPGGTW